MSDQNAVTEMFDGISSSYDYLNHLLSFGIDRRWRRRASKLVAGWHPARVLDVATGTADLAIRLAKDNPDADVTGVDLSTKMLSIGQQKVDNSKLSRRIRLVTTDVAALPFDDDDFDAVTVAFGVRNFSDLEAGLREMVRVCRNGGLVAVLEFSHPSNALVKTAYRWYSRRWIPRVGRKVSKHPSAYTYLPTTVEAFLSGGAFAAKLTDAGVADVQWKTLSGGIATLYFGSVLKNNSFPQ